MILKQQDYPEGKKWTDDDCYFWKGINSHHCVCVGFAYLLSDACFGDIKAKKLETCPSNFKVGDVVRVNNNQHSVIIIKIDYKNNIITLAEGNFNRKVHWGRTYKIAQLKEECNYVMRRNPN